MMGLLLKQPDLGTAILVFAAGFSVIFFAGLKWKYLLPPIILGLVGLVLLVVFAGVCLAIGAVFDISTVLVLIGLAHVVSGPLEAAVTWPLGVDL